MKILVVEDDPLTAEAVKATLANQNYTIEIATDGEAAWELVEVFTYDLLLLDVTLPKLDGISLCQQMRSHGYQMPILLLTARNSSHDKAIGLDAGADDYVVKPFAPEELLARIRALLRRSHTKDLVVLTWGELHLEPASCEAVYREQPLSLTPKEYALLEMFLRNSRRVFSCGIILENLWSFEEVPSDEAVRTHIKGLRHKLKAAGAPGDLIETVYGIGYRLKPLAQESGKETIKRQKARESLPKINRDSIEQETLRAIAEVWERFQHQVHQQVSILEQAAAALLEQKLDSQLQQQAEQEAHSLAGSLGIFGLTASSHLARKIEHLLPISQSLNPRQSQQFSDWVKALRQDVEDKSVIANDGE